MSDGNNPQGGNSSGGYAMRPTSDMPPKKPGMPVWGWVLIGCGTIPLLILPLLAAILFPVFAQAREKARSTACMANVRQTSFAMMMYSEDYDGKFPSADQWMDTTQPYIKSERVLHCPTVPDKSQFGYAMNRDLSKKMFKSLQSPQDTLMIYESTAGVRNANDLTTSLPSPGRHNRYNVIGYADGHVRATNSVNP